MKNIIANTMRIFIRNKEFIYLITVQQVLIFLLMSFLLPYTTAHNVAVIDLTTDGRGAVTAEAVRQLGGVNIVDVGYEDVTSGLIGGNIELAAVIDPDGSVRLISMKETEIENAVALCIEQSTANTGTSVSVNEIPERGISVSNSLGLMIFKTLTSGNLLAALLIKERNNKMKDRILLSGLGTGKYIGGMTAVYLFFMMLGSVIYWLTGVILNFDFGMRNSLGFLLVVFSANVLSVSLYVFASVIAKKEDSLWFMGTFVLMPMALFSGVLFPYEYMPDAMKAIGACFPQRWIQNGISAIQKTGDIAGAMPYLAMVLGLSAALIIIAVIMSAPKKAHSAK